MSEMLKHKYQKILFPAIVVGFLIILNLVMSLPTSEVRGTTTKSILLPTPTPKATTVAKPAPKVPQIDCTGPDGVVFKDTEQNCIIFRQNWGLSASPITRESFLQQPQSRNENYEYVCQLNDGYATRTKDAKECADLINNRAEKKSEYDLCDSNADAEYNSCVSGCNSTKDEGYNICTWAYTGDNPGIEDNFTKFTECKSTENSNWTRCRLDCMSAQSQSCI